MDAMRMLLTLSAQWLILLVQFLLAKSPDLRR